MLIEDKLRGEYPDFLKYCKDAGKKFVHELRDEDFIAYRTKYSVSRDKITELKIFLSFQNKPSVQYKTKITDAILSADSLHKIFSVENFEQYENIFLNELNFSIRNKNCFRRAKIETLSDLLKYSPQELKKLRNLGDDSLKNIFSTLENFFAKDSPANGR